MRRFRAGFARHVEKSVLCTKDKNAEEDISKRVVRRGSRKEGNVGREVRQGSKDHDKTLVSGRGLIYELGARLYPKPSAQLPLSAMKATVVAGRTIKLSYPVHRQPLEVDFRVFVLVMSRHVVFPTLARLWVDLRCVG